MSKHAAIASVLAVVLISGGYIAAQAAATALILWDADQENNLGLVLREYPGVTPKMCLSAMPRCPGVDADVPAWIPCGQYPSPFSVFPDLYVVVARSCALEFALYDSSSNRYRELTAPEVARGCYLLFINEKRESGSVVDVRMRVNGEYAGGARIEFLNPVGPGRAQFDE